MTFAIAALAILGTSSVQVSAPPPAHGPADLPTAGALISEMMGKYAAAPTLTGTVQTIIQTGNSAVKVASVIQYDRSKRNLYIKQVREGGRKGQSILVSDGTRFLYANPIVAKGHRDRVPYLVESAVRREARMTPTGSKITETPMSIGEIYVTGSPGLLDTSIPIDLAIARLEDLQFFRGQLVSFVNKGLEEFNGVKAYRISGQWKEYSSALNIQGDYDLFITPDKELAGYRTFETFSVEQGVFKIISTWLCNFKIGGTPDPKLFTVKIP